MNIIRDVKLALSEMKERLILRSLNVNDAPLLVKWFNDNNNVRFMSPLIRGKKHSLLSVRTEIKGIDKEYERLFLVRKKENNTPIGHAGIDDIFMLDKRGEIFFLIGEKSEQGKGYGKEIVSLLLEHAFKKLKLHSVSASAMAENKASIAILKKAGFKKVGVKRDYNYVAGKYADEILFDLLAGESLLRIPRKNNK